ncbi:sigma-70 family RNA polymerase sigma factor [Henriciella sp. AS95]|uniref:RNA polymerase sigma factor n=1 Tax=Henriciella sp. AS95 TaxID=3135782 RepID=UPI00316BB44A
MTKLEFDALNERLCEALGKCAAGDKTAFKTVYELTAPKLLNLLTHQLKDPEAARDVMQKAFVSIWSNAGKFDPSKGKAFTWMLVIMRNRGLDYLRKRARAPETEEIEHSIPDTSHQPEQAAEISAAGRLVSRHLAKLPSHVAQSISLNVVYGMSSTEIGTALDVSPNTVKGWIRRGLKQMRADIPGNSVSAFI